MVSVVKLHAVKSPSGSYRWTLCHASVRRTLAAVTGPRTSNAAADVGTIIHDLGEHALRYGDGYVMERQGTRAAVQHDGTTLYAPVDSQFLPDGHIVDDEMCDAALSYAYFVRDLTMAGYDLYIEERLPIDHITGEPEAKGTSDAILCAPDELHVVDLKGGFIRVKAGYPLVGDLFTFGPKEITSRAAFGESLLMPNPQLVMYASGALREHGKDYAFKRVRLTVHQPRLNAVDSIVVSMEDFEIWVRWIGEQAAACDGPNPRVLPSEETCRWCAAFPCEEAQAAVVKAAIDDFTEASRDIDTSPNARPTLGELKRLTPLVRMWADRIDAAVLAELSAGRKVDGWKLIEGEMGDRRWTESVDISQQLSALDLDPEHYQIIKIAGPAAIEKLVRRSARSADKPLSKDQWESLQQYITRTPGGPRVAPEHDPRDAIDVDPASAFDD